MKRLLAIVLILTLVLALAMPGMAFAKRGGVPANGKSHSAAAAPEGDEDVKGNGQDKQKDKTAVEGDDEATDEEEAEEPEDADEADEAEEAEDGDESAEAPEKLTGIANALSRLQRNLERKRAKFAEGVEAVLPAGLQNTIAKFMSWLGIEPEEEADGTIDGEGSEETSPTVEPELPDETVDEGAPTL